MDVERGEPEGMNATAAAVDLNKTILRSVMERFVEEYKPVTERPKHIEYMSTQELMGAITLFTPDVSVTGTDIYLFMTGMGFTFDYNPESKRFLWKLEPK